MIKNVWDNLAEKFGSAARYGLVVGVAAIMIATALGAFWLLRTEMQVLFADLTPQDTAAMTAELDRLKIPYALSDQGNNNATILVDKNEVYKTRIKLMGKDIPLHGALGFELFNNSDFGMTEFAQKINYQRAMQGELTRTILSLAEIRDARVLLALPEQGLFKQNASKPKASVALTLKKGKALRAEQVSGIQRLVAAAVPGITSQDVTIVDQNGVALTRAEDDAEVGSGSARLDLKMSTEAYLARKATEVLERALGRGQALASVDVTLSQDSIRSSTDEVVSVPGRAGGTPTGVVVRERETMRDIAAPLNGRNGDAAEGRTANGSSQREIEYAVGHRVEQLISQPGQIRRIQVAVVIKKALSPAQQEGLSKMVAASVGLSPERGDVVVLQALDGLAGNAPTAAGQVSLPTGNNEGFESSTTQSSPSLNTSADSPYALLQSHPVAAGIAALLLAILLIAAVGFRRIGNTSSKSPAASMTLEQRQATLLQIQAWLQDDSAATTPAVPGQR